jgi:nicotinate-nucleotide--dimethylbenzimidazole phosphoribosyltransferase
MVALQPPGGAAAHVRQNDRVTDVLAETIARIQPLDAEALSEAEARQAQLTKPAGALGVLEDVSIRLAGIQRACPPAAPRSPKVAVFAGDHGVLAQGVTPWPQEVTAGMVENFRAGGAAVNVLARACGADVLVVDIGVASDVAEDDIVISRKVRRATADLAEGPAMTYDEARKALNIGIEVADRLVAGGADLLLTGDMGIGNTTPSAALIAAFTDSPAVIVTGRGTGVDDETLARKTAVVARATQRVAGTTDPIELLAELGGLEHAGLAGFILGAAAHGVPVLLDGVIAGSAALVAQRLAPTAIDYCFAGHRSVEPGHVTALAQLGLRPLVDLDLRLGEGSGAALAVPLVQAAALLLAEMATFDSAGVANKDA